jgi:hypothetical protein
MEENRIPKRVIYTNLRTKNLEVNQEINGKMRRGRKAKQLVEKCEPIIKGARCAVC